MDYREHSKDLLARKNSLINAFSAIKQELQMLEQEKDVCKALMSKNEESGGLNDFYNERLINILADLDDCRFRRSIVERELTKIEKGMNRLDEYQRDLLEYFYVENAIGAAEELMSKWFKERSTLYRDKSRALDIFTRSIYGVLQI